jgi:hypothetical protein
MYFEQELIEKNDIEFSPIFSAVLYVARDDLTDVNKRT